MKKEKLTPQKKHEINLKLESKVFNSLQYLSDHNREIFQKRYKKFTNCCKYCYSDFDLETQQNNNKIIPTSTCDFSTVCSICAERRSDKLFFQLSNIAKSIDFNKYVLLFTTITQRRTSINDFNVVKKEFKKNISDFLSQISNKTKGTHFVDAYVANFEFNIDNKKTLNHHSHLILLVDRDNLDKIDTNIWKTEVNKKTGFVTNYLNFDCELSYYFAHKFRNSENKKIYFGTDPKNKKTYKSVGMWDDQSIKQIKKPIFKQFFERNKFELNEITNIYTELKDNANDLLKSILELVKYQCKPSDLSKLSAQELAKILEASYNQNNILIGGLFSKKNMTEEEQKEPETYKNQEFQHNKKIIDNLKVDYEVTKLNKIYSELLHYFNSNSLTFYKDYKQVQIQFNQNHKTKKIEFHQTFVRDLDKLFREQYANNLLKLSDSILLLNQKIKKISTEKMRLKTEKSLQLLEKQLLFYSDKSIQKYVDEKIEQTFLKSKYVYKTDNLEFDYLYFEHYKNLSFEARFFLRNLWERSLQIGEGETKIEVDDVLEHLLI